MRNVIDGEVELLQGRDTTLTVAISQENAVTTASTKPLFLALGVEFFQEVNGQMYPLKNGSFNPLALVTVSGL